MSVNILINAVDPGEIRIAKVRDSKLEEFNIETAAREITQGNIYKGTIARIEPGLHAVFVDYSAERHGFLQKTEIHSDYFQDSESGDHSIQKILRRGQELLVQVTKDPVGRKGAMLSTFISLPGRYMVLMPGSKNLGISRKIEDEAERSRLKELIGSLSIPEEFGVIVRTAGIGCTKTQLAKDLRYLLRLWKNISETATQVETPACLYKERSLAVRSIRDSFHADVTGILIDDPEVYREVRDFIQVISPTNAHMVKLYKGPKPLFSKYELESQIASVFESRVKLKSGGSIVIQQTEALVSIDVNSGKGSHQKSIEQTALITNLEAAEEIARQLRLRDLGGLIVIDFIDMRETKNKLQVEKDLKTHMKEDKARSRVGRISKFGLMELSRQRIRPSIEFGSYEPCKFCQGKGMTPSVETMGLAFLRKLRLETLKDEISIAKGIVPAAVAEHLLNRKRKELIDLETLRNIKITIQGDPAMLPGDSRIVCESEPRDQRSEVRGQRPEERRQVPEDRRQKTEDRGVSAEEKKAEDREEADRGVEDREAKRQVEEESVSRKQDEEPVPEERGESIQRTEPGEPEPSETEPKVEERGQQPEKKKQRPRGRGPRRWGRKPKAKEKTEGAEIDRRQPASGESGSGDETRERQAIVEKTETVK